MLIVNSKWVVVCKWKRDNWRNQQMKQTTCTKPCTNPINTKLYTKSYRNAIASQTSLSRTSKGKKVWLKRSRENDEEEKRIDLVCLFGLGVKLQQSKSVNTSAKAKNRIVKYLNIGLILLKVCASLYTHTRTDKGDLSKLMKWVAKHEKRVVYCVKWIESYSL